MSACGRPIMNFPTNLVKHMLVTLSSTVQLFAYHCFSCFYHSYCVIVDGNSCTFAV